ncbi:hypothetical protein J1G35_14930 [Pseudomonas sp. SH10-3B]|uniref:hypothetical protein n=1 Tax=Pseudomonas sp. SH10-3B TaxID=2816049 RepID=UPI001CA6F1F3|nr:hypothetical protein [Pseudomonas sp. SH10-3B]MBY8947156.1 hypothetical protein [Pseudomonas sp. SH10-3B]
MKSNTSLVPAAPIAVRGCRGRHLSRAGWANELSADVTCHQNELQMKAEEIHLEAYYCFRKQFFHLEKERRLTLFLENDPIRFLGKTSNFYRLQLI